MIRYNIHGTLIAILLSLPGFAAADGATVTLPPATPAPPQTKFNVSGYIAGSYNYLVRSNQFTSG